MRSMWSMRISALLLGAVVALATVATASAQEAGTEVGSDVTSFGIGDWVNLGVRLALVVGVIWAAVHAMRWYVRRMNRGTGRNGLRALEVLETHALGPNRTLHLVRLGDRAVLVGATQERITQLLTVDDPDEFRRLIDTDSEDGEVLTTARGSRAAGAMALVGGLRSGLSVMRARQAEMNERIRADREAKRSAAAEAAPARATRAPRRTRASVSPGVATPVVATATSEIPTDTARTPRFGALKGILGRSERSARAARGTAEAASAVDDAQERESLFDRTLASIEALEVMPNGSTAAGPRARASYTAARPSMADTGRSRDAQIADLQRAIAQARRSAS